MTTQFTASGLEKIDEWRWRVPRRGAMKVPGLIFATDELMKTIAVDKAIEQVINVAQLPGIVGHSIAMPDIHWGYGFPIGGVAAFDVESGVISPGGVGYDINCGVRLLASRILGTDVSPKILNQLISGLFAAIPTGVGRGRKDVKLAAHELRQVAEQGAGWMVRKGFGAPADLEHTETNGCIAGADFSQVSEKAVARGADQVGTLGSGNHFCEVQIVDKIYDSSAASAFGLEKGCVVVLIHTGSRGFGYQVCEDAIETMMDAATKYRIVLPDKQLCCAPLHSPEAKAYMGAMASAANFAFANRQMITQKVRGVFETVFGEGNSRKDSLRVVYDVAHNIAKMEDHVVDGELKRVCVHRKGATRSLPAGHKDTPTAYKHVGQPVIVPGDMGTASYVLVGQMGALMESFGSCCHGAGRAMSRHEALKSARKRNVERELRDKGIVVMATGRGTLGEEMPEAYKNVSQVVSAVHGANLAKTVAKLRPIGCIKG